MKKTIRLTIIFILSLKCVCGQTSNFCDKIIKEPDSMATYKNGFKSILDFFSKNVSPLIDSCNKIDSRLISNLQMQLTIDASGKVIAAYVVRPSLPMSCKTPIQNGFLRMDNWKAARHNGVNVCSDIRIPIYIDWK